MQNENIKIKVENPCPMLLSRLHKEGSTYSCGSCNKELIDFRNKTQQEIASTITPSTCGIFNNTQLLTAPKRSFFYKLQFAGLMLLSFLGFTVQPLNGQDKYEITDAFNSELNFLKEKEKKKKKQSDKTSRKRKNQKNTVYRTVGTPSF